MFLGPFLSLFVKSFEVGVELISVHSPNASASQFDGRETSRAHQGIDLRHADAQVVGHVFQREEARLQGRLNRLLRALGSALRGSHRPKIAPPDDRYLDLFPFAPVWANT